MKKRMICIICLIILVFSFVPKVTAVSFSDVKQGDWAEPFVTRSAELGIMSGYGGNVFGYGNSVTRSEFAAMLVRLFAWELYIPDVPTYQDNADKNAWYYDEIETAVKHGAVLADSLAFRPMDKITREEMAVMLVRGLGYDTLAGSLRNPKIPFADVTTNVTYIAMAYDFGIINGTAATTFGPESYATREQAAAMMIRLYDRYYSNIGWTHAFHALTAYSQKDLIPTFDAISFGWSSLEYDAATGLQLNTTSSGGNSYYIPNGYQEVVQLAASNDVSHNLSIYMSASKKVTLTDGGISNPCSEILLDPDMRSSAITQILAELQRENIYSGVTIDFEDMHGETLKNGFNLFLQELQGETSKLDLALYVCVPPVTSDGVYIDGYDYKTIGHIANKVILMAHDYAARTLTVSDMNGGFTTTPVSPIYEIYTALKAITDPTTGVQDKSKIALAVSFGSTQWKLVDDKVINATAYQPEPSLIYKRLIDPAAIINFSAKYQNPYITYHNLSDDTDNVIWYEDTRSIDAKMNLAQMFGINGISFWRLGIMPAYSDTADRQIFYDVPAWLAEQK